MEKGVGVGVETIRRAGGVAGPEDRGWEMNKDEMRLVVKEALKEWMDAKFAEVGKWGVRGVVVAALALLAYWFLVKSGWTPPV